MARKMKDSGIEWIGEIPEGWEVVPVKRLCTMQAGKNLTSEQIAPEGTYPVYGGNGIRGFFSDYNCDGQFLTVGRQGALCGNVHKINGKVWATEHAVITTPSSYTILDFLYYLLIGMDLNQYVSSTAAQPGLAVGTLLNLKTCYPCSKLEQTQISNYLNAKCAEIDIMLSKTRSSIEDYKKLKQAVITQAVTKGVRGEREMKDSGVEWIGKIPKEWDIIKSSRIIKTTQNGLSRRDLEKSEGQIILKLKNITSDGKIDYSFLNRITLSQNELNTYEERAPLTPWNCKNYYSYRIAMRNMFNQGGERTLMSAIIPPKVGHVHAVYELGFKNDVDTALMSGLMESIPYDFYIKATGKGSGGIGVLGGLPIIRSIYSIRIILTTLLLNSLNEYYAPLWKKCWNVVWPFTTWSKSDPRLSPARFTSLTSEWTWDTPLRTDYERRQALVEIDVLTAMALGMTLQQLKTIYRIQFPVLQSYEADTWYDANGRITFTNNRSLTGVGFTRPEWENAGAVQPIKRGDAPWDGIMKHAPAGYVFARTITDDTMPGGPVQRTIEYAAPFDRCDREQDYETAWKFFEEKYKE